MGKSFLHFLPMDYLLVVNRLDYHFAYRHYAPALKMVAVAVIFLTGLIELKPDVVSAPVRVSAPPILGGLWAEASAPPLTYSSN